MKRILLFIGVVLCSIPYSLCQNLLENTVKACNVHIDSVDFVAQPHYGNNNLLYELLEETEYYQRIENKQNTKKGQVGAPYTPFYNIPVKIWVMQDNQGQKNNRDEIKLINTLEEVNQLYAQANTDIRFYLKCAIEYVHNDKYLTLDSQKEWRNLRKDYRDTKALNMYLVAGSWCGCGRGIFPWETNNHALFVQHFTAAHVAHEIGHTLGLLHTHENKRGIHTNNATAAECFQEYVRRDAKNPWHCLWTNGKLKCEINGDALCDTEASIEDLRSQVAGDCVYAGNGTDRSGQRWTPPTRNFMSYTWLRCRSEFSPGQIAIMHGKILGGFTNFLTAKTYFNTHHLIIHGETQSAEEEKFVAPESITSIDYKIQAGGDTRFQTTRCIQLLPGFEAKAGASFRAHITSISEIRCDEVVSEINYVSSKITLKSPSEPEISSASYAKTLEMIDKAQDIFARQPQTSSDNVLATTISATEPAFEVYPNPAKEQLHIQFRNLTGAYSLVLKNQYGEVIYEKTQDSDLATTLNVGNLQSGTYYLQIILQEQVYTERILINK